ncbi:MAG: Lrp/AsnC family transcriptional regulator [Candidatus Thorarchaeota archaeon]|nr:Lrp/AsnC family transcriptional regulator [Candidatus Thorarchaeota archaeon]
MPKGLDDLDRRLIRILQRDARTPFTHIGKELEQPDTTVHFRTKRLADKGIVSRFAALVQPEAMGYNAAALVRIEIGGHILPDISKDRTATFAEELAEAEHYIWVAVEEPMTIHALMIGESLEDLESKRTELSKSPDIVNVSTVPLSNVVKGWEISGRAE